MPTIIITQRNHTIEKPNWGGGGGEGGLEVIPPKTRKSFRMIHLEVLVLSLTKQGNSVARDLPPTGSEGNTTIFV